MTPQGIASLASVVISSLAPVVQQVATETKTPPDTVKRIQTAFDGLRSGTQAIAQAESTAATLPAIDRVVTDANAVLNVLIMLPLPPPLLIGVRIAAMLVPMLGGVADIVTSSQQQPQSFPIG
jgi:hypothetical protein